MGNCSSCCYCKKNCCQTQEYILLKLEDIDTKLENIKVILQEGGLSCGVESESVGVTTPSDVTLENGHDNAPGINGPSSILSVLPENSVSTTQKPNEKPKVPRKPIKHSIIRPSNSAELRKKHSSGLNKRIFPVDEGTVDSVVSEGENSYNFDFKALNNHIAPRSNIFEHIKRTVFSITEDLVDSNLTLIGSVCENLNVGFPYEFDFYWHIHGDYTVNADNFTIIDTENQNKVTPLDVQAECKRKLQDCLQRLHLPHGFKLFDPKKSFYVHKKGFQVGIVYESSESEELGVLIDLIPCLHIPSHANISLHKEKLKGMQSLMERYSNLTKINENNITYAAVFHSEFSWKVSVSELEKDVLNSIPEDWKICYRVVKYLLQTSVAHDHSRFLYTGDKNQEERSRRLYGLKNSVPSYFLKNEFIKLVIKEHTALTTDLVVEHLIKQLIQICPEDNKPLVSSHWILENRELNWVDTDINRKKLSDTLDKITFHLKQVHKFDPEKYPLLNTSKPRLL